MSQSMIPHPLAPQTLTSLATPVTTLPDAEARQAQISALRDQVAAAIDTLELSIHQNHANYLAKRACWSYDQRIAVETALKTLKRQRQQLQELNGRINRTIKTLVERAREASRRPTSLQADAAFALRFLMAAETLLAPETYQMLRDFAQENITLSPQHEE